jgi:hypothetical protein
VCIKRIVIAKKRNKRNNLYLRDAIVMVAQAFSQCAVP